MDLERTPVDKEDTNYKVSDEVADRQLESEGSGEIVMQKSHVEIQPLLKSEESSLLRDQKSECTQNTGEEISTVVKTEDDHVIKTPVDDQPPLENVTDCTNSSLVNGSEPKSTDVIEVVSVPDKSNDKGTDDLQNSGDKTEVENKDVTVLQTVDHSETVEANNDKGDEKKLESIKPGSTKQAVKAPSTTPTQWTGQNVLLVRGLAPTQSGVSEL